MRRAVLLLALAVVLLILVNAYGQVLLNRWNQPFYDSLSRRDLEAFLVQLGVFFMIAGTLLVLNVAQRWLDETLKLKLREALVSVLVKEWLVPRRAFWLANAGQIGVNPDQRMHEDARNLCDLSVALGTGLVQASVLLATFVGVLWAVSSDFSFELGGRVYAIPGFMVWAALIYSATASFLSYRVGRSLIPSNAERYGREADLRFSLVRVSEHLDGIALAGGEAQERRRIQLYLEAVLLATRRIVRGNTNLTWVTAGFGWITGVAPILVAAPLYFTGRVTFGGVMMAAAAFTQVIGALRWFVDNFSTIADWRATLLRVASFRRAVLTTDMLRQVESSIEYAEGEPGKLVLENLEVASTQGSDMLAERRVEVRAGERILILAAPGTEKTLLFRALAGLWPWGAGRVIRPRDEPIFYLPRGTPYMPRGTLREVLAYPAKLESFPTDAQYAYALTRMGLGRLVPILDAQLVWDRELRQEEQLALAFARLLLHGPPWLLLDNTFGSLDGETLERVISIFNHELERTTVIHIGSAEAHDPLFSRVVHLVKCPVALAYDGSNGAEVLMPARRAAAGE
ncbi:MAG TPA: ABC transporter ATP-binding protein/permease [Gammaproteobacteria bacterium]